LWRMSLDSSSSLSDSYSPAASRASSSRYREGNGNLPKREEKKANLVCEYCRAI
jgi:hypothetical protein